MEELGILVGALSAINVFRNPVLIHKLQYTVHPVSDHWCSISFTLQKMNTAYPYLTRATTSQKVLALHRVSEMNSHWDYFQAAIKSKR